MSAREVAASQVAEWLAGGEPMTIVDVRSRELYDGGHVPGAMWNMASAFDERKFAGIPLDSLVVVYCVVGQVSLAVADRLGQMGYSRPCSMAGGIQAWRRVPGAPLEI